MIEPHWADHQSAILHVPLCGSSSITPPVALVLAIEKNDGIGGSPPRCLLGTTGSRGDDWWQGAVAIVNMPAVPRQHRSILETELGPRLILAEGHREKEANHDGHRCQYDSQLPGHECLFLEDRAVPRCCSSTVTSTGHSLILAAFLSPCFFVMVKYLLNMGREQARF